MLYVVITLEHEFQPSTAKGYSRCCELVRRPNV